MLASASKLAPFNMKLRRKGSKRHIIDNAFARPMGLHRAFTIGTIGPVRGLSALDPNISAMVELTTRRVSQSRN